MGLIAAEMPTPETKPSFHWGTELLVWFVFGKLYLPSHIRSPTLLRTSHTAVEALISKQDTFVLENPPTPSLSTSIIPPLISHIACGICLLQNSGLDY